LAEQHFQNFSDRFANLPVRVAEISRFRSAKEQAEAIELLGKGKIDILIGTHRLLQKDVKFERLGLVIIDEEHRFGVRQKEILKTLRATVDILTLTATPIPRTLGLSLEGLRDFSVIATPPQKRLAIKTFVTKMSDGQVREACLREFKRGGPDKAVDAGLARRIMAVAGAGDTRAGDRRGEDHPAAALRLHGRQGGPRGEVGALEIDGHDRVPFLDAHVEHHTVTQDPRHMHQDVDLAIGINGSLGMKSEPVF
jgi:hypothetical protein